MESANRRKSIFREVKGTTEEIIGQVKKLIKKGNARQLIIKNRKGRVVFQTQLTAGLTGSALLTFLSPLIATIAFFGVVLSDMKVIVEKYSDAEAAEDDYEVEAEIIEIIDEVEDSDDKAKKTIGKDQ
ncbi:MAG TPA: DUF4342 domain-containing protein [Balneolaceae bacterium]|nr:DUF4342 domain-containing protein [Balneolaceae bacterium]